MQKYLARLSIFCSLFLLAGCSGLTTDATVPATATPAPQPATVYYGTYDSASAQLTVTALDGTSGKLLWNYSASSDADAAPVLERGIIYLASNSRLRALNASTGKLLWNNSALTDARIIGAENNVMYADISTTTSSGSFIASLDAINVSDGSVRWSHQYHNGESDLLSNGIIYGSDTLTQFGTPTSPEGAMVVALNASDGTVKWQSLQESGYLTSVNAAQGLVYSYDSFPMGGPYTIEARQASDGSLTWRFPTTPAHATMLGQEGKVLYAQSDDGNSNLIQNDLYALNAATGAVIWHEHVSSAPLLVATLVEQVIYEGDSTNNVLTAINAANGQQSWQAQFGTPSGSGATAGMVVRTVVDGVAYLFYQNGFAALKASSGTILWKTADTNEHTILTVKNGIVYTTSTAADGSSTIEGLSTTSGAVLWKSNVATLLGDPIIG